MKVTITERTEKQKEVDINSCWKDSSKTLYYIIGEDKTIMVQELGFQLSSIRYGYLHSIDWNSAEEINKLDFLLAFEKVSKEIRVAIGYIDEPPQLIYH
jgi:hypothetical protein